VTPAHTPPELTSPFSPTLVPAWNTARPVASSVFNAADHIARPRRPGVAARRHDHAHGRTRVPGARRIAQLSLGRGLEERDEVATQAVHQCLRLGIPRRTLNSSTVNPGGRHHQAGVKKTRERTPSRRMPPLTGSITRSMISLSRRRSGCGCRSMRPYRRCRPTVAVKYAL